MIHYKTCPACGSGDIRFETDIKDHSVTGEIFPVWKCNTCTLLFTQDVPELSEIGRYYASENYISHTDTKKGFVNRAYHFVRNFTLKQKRAMISKFAGLNQGRLLDIGSGAGAFLNEMKLHGWTVKGIEADEETRKRSIKQFSIDVSPPDQLYTLSAAFDVITMWHVLEHVHDLNGYVQQCRKLLSRNGILIIAVPNYTSSDAEAYKNDWAAYDVPRHLYHFSPESMRILMQKNGFSVQEIKPMWFDSFYVSMLSEKYRTGKNNIPRAGLKGLLSNVSAMKSTERCSSVIYIIKPNQV